MLINKKKAEKISNTHQLADFQNPKESKTSSPQKKTTTKTAGSKSDETHVTKPKEEKSSSLIQQSEPDTTEISFYYGNPTVDIVKGFLHIYKDTYE